LSLFERNATFFWVGGSIIDNRNNNVNVQNQLLPSVSSLIVDDTFNEPDKLPEEVDG